MREPTPLLFARCVSGDLREVGGCEPSQAELKTLGVAEMALRSQAACVAGRGNQAASFRHILPAIASCHVCLFCFHHIKRTRNGPIINWTIRISFATVQFEKLAAAILKVVCTRCVSKGLLEHKDVQVGYSYHRVITNMNFNTNVWGG